MDGVGEVGEGHVSAGLNCPAQQLFEGGGAEIGKAENSNVLADGHRAEGGNSTGADQETEEEQATILAMLSKRAASAPAGAGVGRAPELAWAGLKLAAAVLLAAGVGVGLGDGDEFDDAGCGVAQRPGGTCRGAHSAEPRERGGGKLPGADGGSSSGCGGGGVGGRPECEVRAAKCANRMADGQCRRSGQQCRLFAGAGSVKEMVMGIHREIAGVRGEFAELRSAKRRLEKMLADGLFAFTGKVDATSFKVLCTILAEGDVAKASRTLTMPDGTVRTLMRRWHGMGKEYRAMLDLVRWRKAVEPHGTVLLSDNLLLGKADRVDYPDLLADLLEKVTEMTGGNWQRKAEELEEMLRPAVG